MVGGAAVLAGDFAVVGGEGPGPIVFGVLGAFGDGVVGFFLLSVAGGVPGSDGNGMKPPGGASAGAK